MRRHGIPGGILRAHSAAEARVYDLVWESIGAAGLAASIAPAPAGSAPFRTPVNGGERHTAARAPHAQPQVDELSHWCRERIASIAALAFQCTSLESLSAQSADCCARFAHALRS